MAVVNASLFEKSAAVIFSRWLNTDVPALEEAVQAAFLVLNALIKDLALDRVANGRERLPDLTQPAGGPACRLRRPHRLDEAVRVDT